MHACFPPAAMAAPLLMALAVATPASAALTATDCDDQGAGSLRNAAGGLMSRALAALVAAFLLAGCSTAPASSAAAWPDRASGAVAKTPDEAPVPEITIDYPGVIEFNCKALGLKTGDPSMVAELREQLPVWRAAWAKDGPPLLAALRKTAEKPFKFRESIATLQTCEGLNSTSYPLILDARKSLTGGVYDGRVDLFVNDLFHELTHRYIRDVLGDGDRLPFKETPMMLKYQAEAPFVRTHLHLYALHKVIYRELGLVDTWNAEVSSKRRRANEAAAYIRALEIIDAEGPDVFIAELKSSP